MPALALGRAVAAAVTVADGTVGRVAEGTLVAGAFAVDGVGDEITAGLATTAGVGAYVGLSAGGEQDQSSTTKPSTSTTGSLLALGCFIAYPALALDRLYFSPSALLCTSMHLGPRRAHCAGRARHSAL